jgi:ribosomal protein S20
MSWKRLLAVFTVSGLVLAGGLALFAFRGAWAQTETPGEPEEVAPAHPFEALPDGPFEALPAVPGRMLPGFSHEVRIEVHGYNSEDLANALGITVDELNAAYETATNAAIDQAVADGLITQAQADAIWERGYAFPFGHGWGGWLSENGLDYQAFLADALGITQEELEDAYTQARNAQIDRAVDEGILTQEQAELMKGRNALYNNEDFQSSMRSAFESAVQQAVDAGVITQEQADLILQEQNERELDLPDFGGNFGGFGDVEVFSGRGEREGRGPGGLFFWRNLPDRLFPAEPSATAPTGSGL